MDYGLPGKPGYHYTRAFDYFHFEARAATNYTESLGILGTRGLLFGTDYDVGDTCRGIWGLYGTYDCTWANPVRVSTTGVALGTTSQWWLSQRVALQGTALAGLGYGAGGDISGSSERNYHYAGTAQGLLDLRLIIGDLAMLDFRGNQYYISDVVATAPKGSETVTRVDLGFAVRVYDRQAVALQYQFFHRDTHYRGIENQNQEMGVLSLVYTFLSDKGFGTVEWRDSSAR
jgi:hypothetical protein